MNDDNKNNKELMQTFSLLMGELMTNEPASKRVEHRAPKTGNTAVIETPFTDDDDIEREMTAEFWVGMIKHYLLETEFIQLKNPKEKEANIYELQTVLSEVHVFKEEKYVCIRGKLTDESRKYLLESSVDQDGRMKWEQTILTIGNVEKIHLNKYGNECVIEKLQPNDVEMIETMTSDFFSVAYY